MVDIVDRDTRSRMMASIRGKDTKPEMAVRRYLHAKGLRYKVAPTNVPGKPDVFLPKHKTAIFVHGCFWHRHPACRYATTPATNIEFWQRKFSANLERDRRVQEEIASYGFRSLVIWECEVSEQRLEKLVEQIRGGDNVTRDFQAWLEEHNGENWHWYVKRLAANDTLATGSKQVGPYIPKEYAFVLFPSLLASTEPNPKALVPGSIDSHRTNERTLAVTWYRAAKNECRITRWGGKESPILDADSTGSTAILAFRKEADNDSDYVAAWICTLAEEELLSDQVGPLEPGRPIFKSQLINVLTSTRESCALTAATAPPQWLSAFPSGEEIITKCIQLRPLRSMTPDARLMGRRRCEYTIFRSIESLHVLPRLSQGFQTVDEFISYSNSVNNRRKSRSGHSLELHVKEILKEENVPFSHGQESEGHKRPDFLLPSAISYRNNAQPLWMLAAKTTCKDRWRQVLNEADRIPQKHLITLQEGISENQFKEMQQAGLTLVVPTPLHSKYPRSVQPHLMSFASFITMVKAGTRRSP